MLKVGCATLKRFSPDILDRLREDERRWILIMESGKLPRRFEQVLALTYLEGSRGVLIRSHNGRSVRGGR